MFCKFNIKPPALSFKAEFVHWECDMVELVRGQSYLVTMVEPRRDFWRYHMFQTKIRNRPKRYFIDVSPLPEGHKINYAMTMAPSLPTIKPSQDA